MNVSIRRFSLAVAVGALLVTSSCESVSRAPKGSPRVEVEVVIRTEPAFSDTLDVGADALTKAVTDDVMSQADVGLRFYPVLSSSYGPKDQHPDLLMTVSLTELHVKLDVRKVDQPKESEDAAPKTEVFAREIECDVAAKLERRRVDGPPLTVARAEGADHVSASTPKGDQPTWSVVHDDQADHPVKVRQRDVTGAVHTALERALADMVKAIDRELSLQHEDETKAGSTSQR